MIALSCSLFILLIGFICLIAARSTIGGKLGGPEAEHKGLQLLLENLSPEQSRQYDRFGYFDVLGSRTGKRTASVMERRVTSMSLSRITG